MDKTENYDALDELGLIATRSFVAVDRKIRNAVKNDEMLAICAEPGMGKTTAGRISIGRLKESQRYTVIEVPAFNRGAEITGSIINRMIEQLMNESPRRDILARLTQLKRGLLEASQRSKVILVIEEAHDLGPDTLYGIKKLHEIGGAFRREALFSVIFFGQLSFNRLIRAHELRLRIESFKMKPLTHSEALDLFRLYGLKRLSEISVSRITQRSGLTPLGLKYACNVLKAMSGEGVVTDAVVKDYLDGNIADAFKNSGLSYAKLAELWFAKTGIRRDKSTLHKIIAGTYDSNDNEMKQQLESILYEHMEKQETRSSAARRRA